jgi:ATP-dependent exoDNAse (exonuclease V) beta subunit
MKFYYSNIKGLQEEDQVVESIDSSKFGTIFHGVMYALYKPYTNEILTKDILKTLIADREVLSEFVSARMQEEMSLSAVVGKNLIYKELIVEMVISTVNSDISIAPFEYRGGEIKLTGSRIKGFIDRVDVVNGNLRVVDYKTGGVKCKKMITCDDVDTLFTIGDEKRAYTTFQMLFYTLLMRDVASKYGGNVDISVYEIPKINSKAQSTNTITYTLIDRFEERLNGVISDIFNPEIPFYAAERGRKCDYCPIKNFCTK